MIKHFYQQLPGFFDYADIYAEEVARASDGATFIELGTYCGRSLAFMAVEIANSGKRIKMRSYDLWNGFSRQGEMTYEKVERMFSEAGVLEHVDFCQGDSAQAAAHYADQSVDFCFIDADHSKAGCSRDIHAWLPKMKPGGTFAGHDFFPDNPKNNPRMWPGVRDAVYEIFGAVRIQRRGTSWVLSPDKFQ